MWAAVVRLQRALEARALRYWRGREVVKALSMVHAQELAQTPVNQWVQKKAEQAKEIQAVKAGSFPIVDRRSWCYSADTEVLTKRGWIVWPDVTKEDQFATRNSNGTLEWQASTGLYKGKYVGELVSVVGDGLDLLVTPNHRVVGQRAGEVGGWGDDEVLEAEKLEEVRAFRIPCGLENAEDFVVVKKLRKVVYNGCVYCATVPNAILYVRRNGASAVWCGNSFPYIPESLHRLNQPILKNCVSEDTEFLTKRGWVKAPEIEKKDIFATRTVLGGLEWRKAKKVFKYWYEGKMVHFQNKCVDQLVTPDHRMVGRRVSWAPVRLRSLFGSFVHGPVEFQFAKDVAKYEKVGNGYGFQIPLTATGWEGQLPSFGTKIKIESVDSGVGRPSESYEIRLRDWVAFLGLYAAEGACRFSFKGVEKDVKKDARPLYVQAIAAAKDAAVYEHPADSSDYGVGIGQAKASKHWKEIKDLLDRLPFSYTVKRDGFLITSKALWELMISCGNAYTKRVPDWVKELPKEYLEIFLEWAMKGDGHVYPTGARMYATVSRQLADDVQEIMIKAGKGAGISFLEPKPLKNGRTTAPTYLVFEYKMEWVGIGEPKEIAYKGFVYCPAVPPNETLYVRRNGMASWTGNTPYNLRRFTETPIPRRALNLVKNALLSLKWKVTIDDKYDDSDPELLKKVEIAEDCLMHPNLQDSWRTLMEAVIEDFLVGGYGTIEPQITPDYRRPIKLWSVDGSTVRIYADWTEATQDRPHFAQLTGLKGERGIISFLDDELVYIRDNIRSSTPFGLGRMEVAFLTANAFLGAQDMSARAGADQIHKTWLWWPTNVPAGHMETVRRHIQNEAEGQAKVSLMTGLPKPEVVEVNPVTPQDLLLEWQDFLIRIMAAAFELTPMALGLERQTNRSTAAIMAEQDFNSAIVPPARKIEEAITRLILHRTLGWKELKFEFVGLEDPDEMIQVQLVKQLYSTNALTPNEIRDRMQIGGPLPGGWGDLTQAQMALLTAAAVGKAGGAASQSAGMSGGGGGFGGGMGMGMSGAADDGNGDGSGEMEQQQLSPEELAQMDPQQLQQLRDAGLIPPDPSQGDGDAQQPGILQTLSEELQEYFQYLDEIEQQSEEEGQPAPITAKDQKGQEKAYKDRQHQVTKEEMLNRGRDFRTNIYQQGGYRGPIPRKTMFGPGKKSSSLTKGKTTKGYTGRGR